MQRMSEGEMNGMGEFALKLPQDPFGELPGRQKSVELRLLLERSLLELRPSLQVQGVRLCYDAPGALPVVRGDPSVLRRALSIIFLKALEVMPRGGRLSISVSSFAVDGLPERVEVRVEDTGPGIPEEDQEKVFKPDPPTDPDGDGAGLDEARAALISSGGSILVERVPGSGSAYIVTLLVTRMDS